MTRCIIHIGMHKTGSTSIQNSLHGFADDRFLYADLGHAANHSLAIYSLFASRPQRHHLHEGRGRDAAAMVAYITGMRADLERAISAAEGRSLLISGEDISILSSADLVELREYFLARFDDLTIAGCVRPPAGYMASGFQQRLKRRSIARFDLERAYRNYEKTFAKFDEVFGRDNVRLWKYDPMTFPGGCAVRDFCLRLGIALPAERIVRHNESLSRQAVALLYTYCKLGQKYGSIAMTGPENRELGALLARCGSDKFRFSSDVIRPLLERHRADIEWMEARLGQSLDEDLGEHQQTDVRDESDLFPDPEAVSKLLAVLGDRAPAGVTGENPEQVALLVHTLRGERVAARGARHGGRGDGLATGRVAVKERDTTLKVADLIEHAQQTTPGLLDGIPETQAEALVRNVFQHMNDTLAETGDGVMKYAGLGQFRVRKVEREVDGKKVSRTQIIFFRAESGKEDKAHRVETEA